MKINQIIRNKRKELSLTQEQVAEYLGVSTPAVNKWEKGGTYPDITLLPALARLLKTDLNTLMSFHDDLTAIEIENFVDQLDQIVQEQDYETAFEIATQKIRDYPTCEQLIYSAVLYLEGALFLYSVPNQEHYREIFETFYVRLTTSQVAEIRETATSMLISYNRNRENYSKAEELINSIPSSSIDKEEQLAFLYTQQGMYDDAEKLWEHRVLNGVTEIQTALMNMMEIAEKENRNDDATFFADLYQTFSSQFHILRWISYSAQFQLAVTRQDKNKCLSVLQEMLPAMKENWFPQNCPLYRKIRGKDNSAFSDKLANFIQSELLTSQEFSFLREDEKFNRLIKELADRAENAD